jgi:hypothetical protein
MRTQIVCIFALMIPIIALLWSIGEVKDEDDAARLAVEVGYPVMIKVRVRLKIILLDRDIIVFLPSNEIYRRPFCRLVLVGVVRA